MIMVRLKIKESNTDYFLTTEIKLEVDVCYFPLRFAVSIVSLKKQKKHLDIRLSFLTKMFLVRRNYRNNVEKSRGRK